jgi:hypothetical protein
MVRRFKDIANRGSLIRFALVYGGGQTSSGLSSTMLSIKRLNDIARKVGRDASQRFEISLDLPH